jgi:hypothetical protein
VSPTDESLFQRWKPAFLRHLQDSGTATPLKEAAIAGQLADWTRHLTTTVVRSCEVLGWQAAGKGHRLALLPQAGQEYLGIDVMAFVSGELSRWPLPLAAFELENHANDNRVGYSLWKVLCLQVGLRVVFAYRPDPERSRELVRVLAEDVIGSMSANQLRGLNGATVLIVGNRGEGDTFPDGYFKYWLLNADLGRFEKLAG